MSTRDELRSAAFKGKPKKRAKFSYEGNDYELVAPTVGEFVKISDKSKNTVDTSVWSLIYLTVIPGTLDKVFEDTDYNTFMGQSLDGLMISAKDALVEVLSGVQEDEKKLTNVSS